MENLAYAIAIIGAIGSGLIGGVFFAFSSFVMRALARLDPIPAMQAMQSINITVINPHFLGSFMGTAAVSLVAIVLGVMRWGEPNAAYLIVGGSLYFVGTFLVTIACNVPLNDALERSSPESPTAPEVWAHYLLVWTRWNHVRTVAALLAMLSFCLAL